MGAVARAMVDRRLIPREYVADALHVAVASVHGIEYLVTWNCKHLANARIRARLEETVAALGHRCPVICTPEELMEDAR